MRALPFALIALGLYAAPTSAQSGDAFSPNGASGYGQMQGGFVNQQTPSGFGHQQMLGGYVQQTPSGFGHSESANDAAAQARGAADRAQAAADRARYNASSY